jgi:hypothetical protein
MIRNPHNNSSLAFSADLQAVSLDNMSGRTEKTTISAESSLEKRVENNITDAIPELKSNTNELPDVPEGGTKAYLAILGAFTGMFVSFGWVNCIALFQAEYKINQLKDYTTSEVSWITSTECRFILRNLQNELLSDYSFLYDICLPTQRPTLRSIWPTLPHRNRNIHACLWPHDGKHL